MTDLTRESLAAALAKLRGCTDEGQHIAFPGFLVQGDPSIEDWEHSTLTEQGYADAILAALDEAFEQAASFLQARESGGEP